MIFLYLLLINYSFIYSAEMSKASSSTDKEDDLEFICVHKNCKSEFHKLTTHKRNVADSFSVEISVDIKKERSPFDQDELIHQVIFDENFIKLEQLIQSLDVSMLCKKSKEGITPLNFLLIMGGLKIDRYSGHFNSDSTHDVIDNLILYKSILDKYYKVIDIFVRKVGKKYRKTYYKKFIDERDRINLLYIVLRDRLDS